MIKIKKEKILNIMTLSFIIILGFSIIFYNYDHTHFNGLNEKNDTNKFFNRFYFTITTLSSAGYGDITPKSIEVKVFSIILQTILIGGIMGGLFSLFG
mgnify:CR=1 FL=1